MERKKASDYRQELCTASSISHIHGAAPPLVVNSSTWRQEVCRGWSDRHRDLGKSCPLNYAGAQQVPKDDSRIKAEAETVSSPQGNGSIKGYFVRPAKASGKLPGVLVIHENRGLNPYIEDVARRLATANFVAFAPHGLTSVGGYPGDNEKGGQLFQQVDKPKMTEDFIVGRAG